jgi:hypothetical protein
MHEKLVMEIVSPETQTVEAVKELLVFLKKPVAPLPPEIKLSSATLVLSSKKDCFYTTTARDCSCPARCSHPGLRCKHMRKYYPESVEDARIKCEDIAKKARAYQKKMRQTRSTMIPSQSIASLMDRTGFRPVVEGE